jgi:hypothetical protein
MSHAPTSVPVVLLALEGMSPLSLLTFYNDSYVDLGLVEVNILSPHFCQ